MVPQRKPGIVGTTLKLIVFVFVGFIVAGVFLNLYYMAWCFLLGTRSESITTTGYWVCLIAGIATACWLMQRMWSGSPPSPPQKPTGTTIAGDAGP